MEVFTGLQKDIKIKMSNLKAKCKRGDTTFDEIAQMTKTICELKKGLRVSGRKAPQKLNQMISQKKVNPPNVTPNNSKHDQPDPEELVNDYILREKNDLRVVQQPNNWIL